MLIVACWLYLLAVVAICLTVRLAGDRWWVATVLLMAPRWPFALPLAVLWPWALAARRWHAIVITFGASMTMLFPIMGFRVSIPNTGSAPGEVRLLTCNIHRQHLNTADFARFIATVRPDVIALQGWSDMHREALFAETEWNVQREGELLVASHFPIERITPLELVEPGNVSKGEQGVAMQVDLTTPQGSISLICLHLASPHAGLLSLKEDAGDKLAGNVDRRWRESDRLLDHALGVPGPLLMAGDFNTTDDSPIFREHWGEFTDAFSECGQGFGYTYIIGHTQLRIDHILAGPSWEVIRCWTGPDVGAAHRPLVADLNSR